MYSQNNEEQLIQEYFSRIVYTIPNKTFMDFVDTITVLEIGANNGKTFSNSLRLIELGANAVLIEPSPKAFEQLTALHKDNAKVSCYPIAILKADEEEQMIVLNESGSHLPDGSDISLVSSLITEETERWRKSNVEFNQVQVLGMNFKTFVNYLIDNARLVNKKLLWSSTDLHPIFDLISIDVEGLDYDVLTQIDLTKCKCRMLIVETNGKDNEKYIVYAANHGMTLLSQNAENLIFVK